MTMARDKIDLLTTLDFSEIDWNRNKDNGLCLMLTEIRNEITEALEQLEYFKVSA
jgi:hypothetical protein